MKVFSKEEREQLIRQLQLKAVSLSLNEQIANKEIIIKAIKIIEEERSNEEIISEKKIEKLAEEIVDKLLNEPDDVDCIKLINGLSLKAREAVDKLIRESDDTDCIGWSSSRINKELLRLKEEENNE